MSPQKSVYLSHSNKIDFDTNWCEVKNSKDDKFLKDKLKEIEFSLWFTISQTLFCIHIIKKNATVKKI